MRGIESKKMSTDYAEAPGILLPRSRSTAEVLRRAFAYLKPYKWKAAANIGCALLSLVFSFAFPQVTQYIIDDVVGHHKVSLFMPLLALVGAYFLRDFFNSLRIRINNDYEQDVVFDMRRDIYARLQRLPSSFFDKHVSGDLMTRVMEDVTAVERILIDGSEQGVTAVLSIVVVAIILFTKNAQLALCVAVPLPLLMWGTLWYTTTAHKRYRLQRQAAANMNALLADNLQGVRQIKAFNQEKQQSERFCLYADALREGTLVVMNVWSIYSPAMTFIGSLGTVLVLWVGGPMVMSGSMTLGQLVGFVFYLSLFYDPIGKLHGLNQMLQAARASSERVFDILDTADEHATRHGVFELIQPIQGEVRYENVDFSYGTGTEALKNITLHALPGQMIALVGPTGAGKSTLVNLLLGFYERSSGTITIDGQDIDQVTIESLRSQIAIVTQEPFLFNGSIRENILFACADASEEDLLSASQAANCHKFILKLPQGYNSQVGERGTRLSVGEKQRISIARALLKNAPILILDEATASVDAVTERLIQEALRRLMAHRTSFVIAHRLSTIRHADQILVMQHGEIIERGTHKTLLQKGGLYEKLCSVQEAEFLVEGLYGSVSVKP
jgi:ATP-binding cassette, subfamily B, bacterial